MTVIIIGFVLLFELSMRQPSFLSNKGMLNWLLFDIITNCYCHSDLLLLFEPVGELVIAQRLSKLIIKSN
jgi:hypothetical protein